MSKRRTTKPPTYKEYAQQMGIPYPMVQAYNRVRANQRRAAQRFAAAVQATGQSIGDVNMAGLYQLGLPDIRTQAFRRGGNLGVDLDFVQHKIDQQLEYNTEGYDRFRRRNVQYLENALSSIEEYSEDLELDGWVKWAVGQLTPVQSELAAQRIGVHRDFFAEVMESDQDGVRMHEGKAKARYYRLRKYLASLGMEEKHAAWLAKEEKRKKR